MSYIQLAGSAGRGFCLPAFKPTSPPHKGGWASAVALWWQVQAEITQAPRPGHCPFPERVVPKVQSGPGSALSTPAESGPVVGPGRDGLYRERWKLYGQLVGGDPRPQPGFKEKMGQGRGGRRGALHELECEDLPSLLFGIREDSTPCGSLEADRPGSKSSFWHLAAVSPWKILNPSELWFLHL